MLFCAFSLKYFMHSLWSILVHSLWSILYILLKVFCAFSLNCFVHSLWSILCILIEVLRYFVHSFWSVIFVYTYLMPEMSRSQGICVGTFWLVQLCSVPCWLFLLKHQFCSGKEEPIHSVKIWNVTMNCEFSYWKK